MIIFNKIIPKYNYDYFDRYNQLQTKQLNIFQWVIRKIFGCYSETHLSNVAKKAYIVTLNDQFRSGPEKLQKLLKLIAKAESVYGYSQYYIQLPNCNLPNGREVSVGVHYGIRKPASGDYKISSIDFKLGFSRNNQAPETYNISIFKNKSAQTVVHLPDNLLVFRDDTKNSIERHLKGERLKIITDLLAKSLNDSSTSSEMVEIQCFASDHKWIFLSFHDWLNNMQGPTPDTLNSAQKEAMEELGWRYLTTQGTSISGVKRVYLFRREEAKKNQNLASLGFNQQLSIAFAASCLETSAREY